MDVHADDKVLFVGDSITEGQTKAAPGYVTLLARTLKEYPIVIDRFAHEGYTVQDILDGLPYIQQEVPNSIALLVGINDVWHHVNRPDIPLTDEVRRFKQKYRELVVQLQKITPHLLIMEPFMFPHPLPRLNWQKELNEKIIYIRQIVYQYKCEYISFDQLFIEWAMQHGYDTLTHDGIHPTEIGQQLMATHIQQHLHIKEV